METADHSGAIDFPLTLSNSAQDYFYLGFDDGRSIFRNVAPDFIATRYHSLVVSENDLPECLEVSARTPDGVIMGFRHRSYAVEGIQFHPESLLTVEGPRIIANWVNSLRVPTT